MKSRFKRFTSGISIIVLFALCSQLLNSCAKETEGPALLNDSYLSVSIAGIIDDMPIVKTGSTKGNSGLQASAANALEITGKAVSNVEVKEIQEGLFAAVSSSTGSYGDEGALTHKSSVASKNQLSAATTPMTTGYRYRIILYDTNGTFVSSTAGVSGSMLNVPVVKGKTYKWAIFSYNNTTDPGAANTTVETDNRDLLHASGEVTIPGTPGTGADVNQPLYPVLKHKLARIEVQIDATAFPGTITALTASLGSSDYFKKGTLDLLTGTISGEATLSVASSPISSFGPALPSATQTAYFYTSKEGGLNPFSVQVQALTIQPSSGTALSLATAQTFTFTDLNPARGKNSLAKIQFTPQIAEYTCSPSTATVHGSYKVGITLDPSTNYINYPINITKPGMIEIVSDDKDGMKFGYSGRVSSTGAMTLKLLPIQSVTKFPGVNINTGATSVPMTAEQVSQNGANNQRASYSVYNVLEYNTLCGNFSIDIKPWAEEGAYMNTATSTAFATFTASAANKYWPANNALFASEGAYSSATYSPTDGRIKPDIANLNNFMGALPSLNYNCLWYVFARNVSGSSITSHVGNMTSTSDYHFLQSYVTRPWSYTGGGSVANKSVIGSLDVYLNNNGVLPTANSSTNGAHGAGSNHVFPASVHYAEVSNAGLTVKIGNYWYKYRLMWSSKRGANNDPYLVSTKQALVLYGIYSTAPTNWVPRQTAASETGTATGLTYTGADEQIGDRDYLSYNP